MLKILLSGTKKGFGFAQFANNLDPADLNEISHVLTDGRMFVRFNDTGVTYYSISFSENYKIYTIARSCLDVAGTGGYVAISLLVPKDKKISCGIRGLLIDLMNVYFSRYVDAGAHVMPEMEEIAFFTYVFNQRAVVESDDEIGEVMNWDNRSKTETAFYAYADDNELDRIFDVTYLEPLNKYAKVTLMERRIVDNMELFLGQFYSQRPIRIPELTFPAVYRFAPYTSSDGSKLSEFHKYERKNGRVSAIDSYTNCEFYEFSRISFKISKQYRQPFDSGEFSVEEGLRKKLLYKVDGGQICIAQQELRPLQITIKLHAKCGDVDVTGNVSFAEKRPPYEGGNLWDNPIFSKEITFSSDKMDGVTTLCVGSNSSCYAAFPPQTYQEILSLCQKRGDDSVFDYYVDVRRIKYSLDERSDIGAEVKFSISGKSYDVTFDNANREFSLFLPVGFDEKNIEITTPSVGHKYKVSQFDNVTNKFLFRKPDPIKLVVKVNCNQQIDSLLKIYLQEGGNKTELSYNQVDRAYTAVLAPDKRMTKQTVLCAVAGQEKEYEYDVKLEEEKTTQQISLSAFCFECESGIGEVIFYYKGKKVKRVDFGKDKSSYLIIPEGTINDIVAKTSDDNCLVFDSKSNPIKIFPSTKRGQVGDVPTNESGNQRGNDAKTTNTYFQKPGTRNSYCVPNGNHKKVESFSVKIEFKDKKVIPENGSFECEEGEKVKLECKYDSKDKKLTVESTSHTTGNITVTCKDKKGNSYTGTMTMTQTDKKCVLSRKNHDNAFVSYLKKNLKDVSMIAGVVLIVIIGAVYCFANLRKEKYTIVFKCEQQQYKMKITELSIDDKTVPVGDNNECEYKVKKSEIKDKNYKINVRYTFTVNGVQDTCVCDNPIELDLPKDNSDTIFVTPRCLEFYKEYAFGLWDKLQSVDVTYGGVKKFHLFCEEIEKWEPDGKYGMYSCLCNEKKEIEGSKNKDNTKEENNRQTVKIMIKGMYDFFEKLANKQLTIDDVKYMTENYKSYLTNDQKIGFERIKSSPDTTAFNAYKGIKYDDNTSLSNIFERYQDVK